MGLGRLLTSALTLLGLLSPAARGSVRADELLAYREDYLAFAELLVRYRQGEDPVLEALRVAGLSFAERHGRTDAPQVVEAYARLSAEERRQGWRDYERFAQLWGRVADADPLTWSADRHEVLVRLAALTAECRRRADVAPAGRALSLSARIRVNELEGLDAAYDERASELAALAEADALDALALFESARQRTPRLEPRWLLARLATLEGRLFIAREHLEELLSDARTLRADDYRAHALIGLIEQARRRGDFGLVDRLLEELASFRAPRECWPLLREHAWRLIVQDAPEAALRFLERNPPIELERTGDWRELLGLAHLRSGNLDAARAAMTSEEGAVPGVQARLARCALALREGRADEALAEIADLERGGGLGPWQTVFARSLSGEALLDTGRPELAFELLSEGIELSADFEARLDGMRMLDEGGGSVVGERLGLHAIGLAARALCETGRELEAAALIEAHQSRALRPASVDAALIRAWAARYEHGLVSFVCGADEALSIHVTRDGRASWRRIPRSRRAISGAVRRLREAAVEGDPARIARIGGELGAELLPASLVTQLALGARDGRLLFLLHGPLERLAVELVHVDSEALDELAVTLTLPGIPQGDPDAGFELAALGEWQVLGDPFDARGAPRLAAAGEELAAVLALHDGAEARTGHAFDRAALVEVLESERPLHVATHLLRAGECGAGRLAPLALELDGGALFCAGELLALAPRCPLVVLSACQSAEGRFLDAEGLQGIARAFLESGTRNLLVTTWPVEDGAARTAAVRFHEALVAGEPPSHAARAARRAVREKGATTADWAAFRLLGRD